MNQVPEHMTVGYLRRMLAGIPDDVACSLSIPAGFGSSELTIVAPIAVEYNGGVTAQLRPATSSHAVVATGHDAPALPHPAVTRVEVAAASARSTAQLSRLAHAVAVYSRDEPPFDVGGAAHLLGVAVDNLCAEWANADIADADADIIEDSLDPGQRARLILLADRLRRSLQSDAE